MFQSTNPPQFHAIPSLVGEQVEDSLVSAMGLAMTPQSAIGVSHISALHKTQFWRESYSTVCYWRESGYLAPKYEIRGQLTRKADIYSFGVLLVEIVSGRCNTNTRYQLTNSICLKGCSFAFIFPDHSNLGTAKLLLTWQVYEWKELVGLVDTSLDGDFDAEEACRFSLLFEVEADFPLFLPIIEFYPLADVLVNKEFGDWLESL
ncbi:unnamed protein product [Prunus armeniaca]|uniref:Serine-threonine/tyrosine-protein kinase catalytic domain-containing protein n=1 Tax=Prunus armeniaca TaxID=36596 RepID=A0A6J5TLS3_PRUAR|nr:unnamed protein product [Prunus armeniaca]